VVKIVFDKIASCWIDAGVGGEDAEKYAGGPMGLLGVGFASACARAPPAVEKSVIGFLENRRTNFLQLQICRKYFTTAEFLFFHSSSYTTPLTFLQLANFYKIYFL
jgi:hypothetical protein